MKVLGALLAGGASSRFGSDKALALLNGRRLIDHAMDALCPHCDALAVVGREEPGLTSIADWPQPGLGPLGGVAGALRYARHHGFNSVLTASVDCLTLPRNLRDILGPAPAYISSQPVIGWWPAETLAALEVILQAGKNRSVRHFADQVGARPAEHDFALPNINSPADLAGVRTGRP